MYSLNVCGFVCHTVAHCGNISRNKADYPQYLRTFEKTKWNFTKWKLCQQFPHVQCSSDKKFQCGTGKSECNCVKQMEIPIGNVESTQKKTTRPGEKWARWCLLGSSRTRLSMPASRGVYHVPCLPAKDGWHAPQEESRGRACYCARVSMW